MKLIWKNKIETIQSMKLNQCWMKKFETNLIQGRAVRTVIFLQIEFATCIPH